MVGQADVVRDVLICLIAGGHALLEGVPGLGKTMLVRTLAEALDLAFSRIQFTPDLMPADITGTNILVEDPEGGRQFAFQPGPVFANLVLADEINRATPKTQSALLEAMAEKTVTVANEIHLLDEPFFVLATQNPLEMEGTYPLPEAQLDRFFFKLVVPYPSGEDLTEIVRRTTAPAMPEAAKVADGAVIRQMGLLSRQVPIASSVTDYVVRMTLATHPENAEAPDVVRRYVRYGVSPRGAQAIVLGSKIRALIEGRLNVAYDDVRAVAAPALRHRLILNFDAESSGVTADDVLGQLISSLPD
jgi:MoxR-like ATPase